MDPTCQQGTVEADGGSVMVWGMCSWRDMEPLICLYTPLKGNRYDSWCQLSAALLQTSIESMPRRVVALLRARGGLTQS
ncbi:hypothetical protein TNCV_4233191 [Trichonephila clavipes]|nr:hypothetical protein TNCV_4233191 [Trichonephila clavipes]